jgi:acyl transferase domain-containing protein/NAD(P)-dependent dehydrogenase (short-subunit alcohol dehydrogenase family)
LVAVVLAVAAELLPHPMTEDLPFVDAGMTSILAIRLREAFASGLGVPLPPTLCYDYPSVRQVCQFVRNQQQGRPAGSQHPAGVEPMANRQAEPIGIVGMACRFPGNSNDAHSFWSCLAKAADEATFVPADRFDVCDFFDVTAEGSGNTMYVSEGYFVESASNFDNLFFGISAAESQQMDPQQRVMLEVAFQALHDAQYTRETMALTSTGVYVGAMSNDVTTDFRTACSQMFEGRWPFSFTLSGIEPSVTAGRVSYCLNLSGPAVCINTACSSSLVALELADMAVQAGRVEQAVVAGVSLMLSPFGFIATCKARMLSPSGRCATFDASADGFARGEGCGAVVLQQMQAGKWRVPPHATLLASATNQDGRSAGLTAPSGPAQSQVIGTALGHAKTTAAAVCFVESHGTGTPLGDPIECRALSESLQGGGDIVIGAVKTNMGHLEAAAGIISLIKTCLVLKCGAAPPNLRLKQLNPMIEIGGFNAIFPSPGDNEKLRLPDGMAVAIGGISSFGFSGTNAHTVLQGPAASTRRRRCTRKRIAFLCTGQGSQYHGMGKQLFDEQPVFRDALTLCARILQENEAMNLPLIQVLYSETVDPELIRQTRYAQPCLFAVEYALIELWRSWGVVPDVVCGHSLGEYVAAVAAGLLPLQDGLLLVARRAKLMDELPSAGHAMVSVFHSEIAVSEAIETLSLADRARVSIACINGPTSVVVSGDAAAVSLLVSGLGGTSKKLFVSHAFHSPMMEPILGDFTALLEDLPSAPAASGGVQFVSNLRDSGQTPGQSADHWARHVMEPVDFLGGVTKLAEDGCSVFVEIGPAPVLIRLGRRCIRTNTVEIPEMLWIASAEPPASNGAASSSFAAALAAVFNSDGHVFDTVLHHWTQVSIEHPVVQREEVGTTAETVYVGRIQNKAKLLLGQHLIHGAAIMPAAALIDTAAAVVAAHTGLTRGVKLLDVVMAESMPLVDGPTQVRVELNDNNELSVESRGLGTSSTHLRAVSDIVERSASADAGLAVDLQQFALEMAQLDPIPVAKFYADAARAGLQYQSAFQPIVELRCTGGSVMAKLLVPSSSVLDGCKWNPCVLDGLFQLNVAVAADKALLPFAIGSIELLQDIPTTGALYGRLTLTHQASGVQVSNLFLYSDAGALIVRVMGMELRKPNGAAGTAVLRDCLWCANWEDASGVSIRSPSDRASDSAVLVLAWDSIDGSAYAHDNEVRQIKSLEAKWFEQTWSAIVVAAQSTIDSKHIANMLHDIVRLLALASGSGFPIWIVTSGAQSVCTGHGVTDPWSAAIWGFCRSARIEIPQIALGCIDVNAADPAVLQWQIQQHPAGEPEVAISGRDRRLRRMFPVDRRSLVAHDSSGDETSFPNDRTYLITGGLSGLGLRTAAWMCERGARHLALLSRSGVAATGTAESASDWAGLQMHDGVVALSCDVSDTEQVAGVMAQIKSTMPPIVGVIHAAGVLDDALVENQTAAHFTKVFGPKLGGAFLLHEAVADCEPAVEMFVVYSSVAGMLGSAAQSNYAAANSGLDAFCSWRRAQGLPAQSLAWGPWAAVGMAARTGTAGRVLAHGLGELSPPIASAALRLGLATGCVGYGGGDTDLDPQSSTLLVVPANWSKWVARFPGSRSLLRDVCTTRLRPPANKSNRAVARDSAVATAGTSDTRKVVITQGHTVILMNPPLLPMAYPI